MQSDKNRNTKSPNAFRSIGEAAAELGLQTHVLRFWETKFRQLSPVKRPDGRRFYRPEDMLALKAVQVLVHEHGMTIKGAQSMLNEQGIEAVLNGDARLAPAIAIDGPATEIESPAKVLQERVRAAFDADTGRPALTGEVKARLETVLDDITDVKRRLDALRMKRAA